MRYHLIIAKSPDALEQRVDEAISDGFCPCGAPGLSISRYDVVTYFQAVWKPNAGSMAPTPNRPFRAMS